MNRPQDALDQALTVLPTEPLNARFSERVLKIARASLESEKHGAARVETLKLALGGAMVPALLATAAIERAVETVAVAGIIYAHSSDIHGRRGP